MSENSLPRAVDNDERIAGYLEDLRELGYGTTAEAHAHLFDLGMLFFDESGRIVS